MDPILIKIENGPVLIIENWKGKLILYLGADLATEPDRGQDIGARQLEDHGRLIISSLAVPFLLLTLRPTFHFFSGYTVWCDTRLSDDKFEGVQCWACDLISFDGDDNRDDTPGPITMQPQSLVSSWVVPISF